MHNRISLSVIMPALNEEDSIKYAIEDTLSAFDSCGIAGELIVVNDGSTDNTQTVIDHYIATDSRVSVVRHNTCLGIGRSFWDGKNAATCDVVVMYPGDNEMIASEMMKYIDLMTQTDLVIPYIVNTSTRSVSRQFLSRLYATLVTSLLQIHVHHTNGLILYRKAVIDTVALESDGYMFQTEILAKLVRNGYLYAEVPYFIKPRLAGESKAVSHLSISGIISLIIQLYRLTKNVYTASKKEIVADSATYRRRGQLLNSGLSL